MAGGFASCTPAQFLAPGMRAARRKRQRLYGGIVADAHPRRTRACIDNAVSKWREAAIRLTRQHEHAVSTRNTRPACYTRQLVGDPHPERLSATFQFVTWMIEQRLSFVLIDDSDGIALEPHANTGSACGRSRAPQTIQFGRRVRRLGACRSQKRHGKERHCALHHNTELRSYG